MLVFMSSRLFCLNLLHLNKANKEINEIKDLSRKRWDAERVPVRVGACLWFIDGWLTAQLSSCCFRIYVLVAFMINVDLIYSNCCVHVPRPAVSTCVSCACACKNFCVPCPGVSYQLRYTCTYEGASFICASLCVCCFPTPGNPGASDHAPGGRTVSGGPHLHWRLPPDLQDLPFQPYGGWQKTAGMVPGGQPPGHGELVCLLDQLWQFLVWACLPAGESN